MQRISDISMGIHEPFARKVLRTREEMMQEISLPTGRFTSPEMIEDRLALFISERLRSVDPLRDGQIFEGTGVPLNWQRLLRYLYDHKIIVAPDFYQVPIAHDRPKLQNFGLILNSKARRSDGRAQTYSAFGGSFSTEEAMSKATGEAIERYFMSIYKREGMLHTSPAALKKKGRRALDLAALNSFLPSQKETFAQFMYDADTPLYWVEGVSYPSGKKILMPAQLVFWNYDPNGEKVLARSTTSGCAGHFTKDEAILSALLEEIQRDAFLIFWLNHISPPVLDVDLLKDPEIDAMLEYLKRYRFDAKFVNTTSDIKVPSITCVLTDTASKNGPLISIGGGTGFDVKAAIVHAAVEALLVNNYAATLPTYEIPDTYKPFTDVSIDRNKRLSAWRGPRMAERFAFFTAGVHQDPRILVEMTKGKDTPATQLDYLVKEFAKFGVGYEISVYEAKDPVLVALGYHVVRTIVPRLYPLYLLEYAAPLDSKRIREVPKKLGYEAAPSPNPWPHPFP